MKTLTRLRLINWHRFENETVPFGKSVLISGENGAGKSTLLDAIQFVITCSKSNFNKAAHENGKRKLSGYIRCKTGREDKPYERSGEITAHIALEFFDEAKKQFFIVGAVIDSASEDHEVAAWYLMENQKLEDGLFFRGNVPQNISSFRSTNKKIKQFTKTQTEARRIMLSRFGRLEDKFFTLIPKALAFKPIKDIKDFVYSYVLDEKEVNIDALRENVRSYQDLERTLNNVKVRIERLGGICSAYEGVLNCLRMDRVYDYYIARAALEIAEGWTAKEEHKIRSQELALEETDRKILRLEEENRQKNEVIISLSSELMSDESFQAVHRLEEEVKRLEEALKENNQEKSRLMKSVNSAREQMKSLLEVKDVQECAKDYAKILVGMEECTDVASAIHLTEQVIQYKSEMYEKVQMKIAQIKVEQREKQLKLAELNQKMERLKQKKLPFDDSVVLLQRKVKDQLERLSRKGEPRILCELLEITDPVWQNAVEGYLNTQRFYMMVEPENFDVAASVYDRLRSQKQVYGVGVINPEKLEDYDTAPEDTLASVVTSKNIWARRYINFILGKVHLCKKAEELRNYKTAVTKECMRYQNRVIMAIRPEIFATPFIGVRAFQIQLEQAKKEQKLVLEELDCLKHKLFQLDFVLKPLDNQFDVDIKYRLPVLSEMKGNQEALKKNREQIKELKKDATYIQKQIRLENLKKEYAECGIQIGKLNREKGSGEEDIRNSRIKIKEYQEQAVTHKENMNRAMIQLGEEGEITAREYEKQVDEKSPEKFKENYERRKRANLTTKEQREADMVKRMQEYKISHDFGAPDSLAGYPEFSAEYDKLVNSELLSYEDKVYRAKEAAEHEFREQFLSKLQENIRQAHGEFKELNRSLKDIHFSGETYEFQYGSSRKYNRYYQMIMSDFNVMQGQSLFAGVFNEEFKEVIEELFEKLTLDDEESGKTLQEYTDYRSYMDYDIKISHDDGTYFLYSKVAEEKSGGETQTPFYITVAASFIQLYRNSIGNDAIGLVMFDEAFNNMDDERIAGVLEFLNHSGLQIMIAAPPDKIQYIGQAVEKTLLVLKGDSMSFVEDFSHETV